MDNGSVFNVLKISHSTEIISNSIRFCYAFIGNDLVIVSTQVKKQLLACTGGYYAVTDLEPFINHEWIMGWDVSNFSLKSVKFFYLFTLIVLSLFGIFIPTRGKISKFHIFYNKCTHFYTELFECNLDSNCKIMLINFIVVFCWKGILTFIQSIDVNNVNLFVLTPSRWVDRIMQAIRQSFYGQGIERSRRLSLEEAPIDTTHHLTHLAHELKLPLFNIKSFLETLYEYNFRLTEVQRLEFLETANKEANRLVHLIDNILAFQSLKSLPTQEWYKTQNFNVMEIISQVINSYALLSRNKEVQFLYIIPPVSVYSYGNEDLIAQVINNLVGNSIKYTFLEKKILVRTRSFTSFSILNLKKQTKLQVCVLDQGVGMSKSSIYGNFDPHRAKRKVRINPRIKGNGLGLNIVKHILLYHQSNLCVLSKIKKGSAVSFTLFSGTWKGARISW